MVSADAVDAVVRMCENALGDSATWVAPSGYPDSLALCTIDAIWSIGIRYSNVKRVIARYRAVSPDADAHNLDDLLAAVDQAGGTDGWRSSVGTRHRTSTRGGIFKADAVVQAAASLRSCGLNSTTDVRSATEQTLTEAEAAWRSIRGQRSGISWHYLLLTGAEEVKPDRMICRFIERATGAYPSPPEARALVRAAAAALQVSPRTLDHRIWQRQSGRS
jgi:hypothetical protein